MKSPCKGGLNPCLVFFLVLEVVIKRRISVNFLRYNQYWVRLQKDAIRLESKAEGLLQQLKDRDEVRYWHICQKVKKVL